MTNLHNVSWEFFLNSVGKVSSVDVPLNTNQTKPNLYLYRLHNEQVVARKINDVTQFCVRCDRRLRPRGRGPILGVRCSLRLC